MAPEVIKANRGRTFKPEKADIFSLGIIFYILVFGRSKPFGIRTKKAATFYDYIK